MPENAAKSPHVGGGWPVAIAATLGMSVSYVDRQTLAAIAPAVRDALHIDHQAYGWLLSAFSLAYLAFAPVAGILIDRLGARRGFALAVVAWSCVAGLHALATSFAILFALRVALGTTEAPSFPAAAQAIRRAIPGARRPAAYGLLFTGSSVGAMIAGPLALAIEGRAGFRFAFLATAACGTIWVPLWLFTTRADRLPDDEPTEKADASIYRGARDVTPAPETWLRVATSRPVVRALVAIVGSAPLLMFTLNFTSQYLVERWGMARTSVGFLLVFPPLLFDAGAVGFGWLASLREGAARRTHVELLLVSTALASLLALAPFAPTPAAAIALFSLASTGGGGIYVLVTADVLGRVPLARTSAVGGLCAASQSIAHIIAAPLVGYVIDRSHGYGAALVGLGLVVVPTSLAFVALPADKR